VCFGVRASRTSHTQALLFCNEHARRHSPTSSPEKGRKILPHQHRHISANSASPACHPCAHPISSKSRALFTLNKITNINQLQTQKEE
jgi:hypothetical protein